jgi:hypothetical protein
VPFYSVVSAGNRHAQAEALDRLPGVSNYFVGRDSRRWRSNVPSYSHVRFDDVYRGVDVIYYGRQSELEYDLMLGSVPWKPTVFSSNVVASRRSAIGGQRVRDFSRGVDRLQRELRISPR